MRDLISPETPEQARDDLRIGAVVLPIVFYLTYALSANFWWALAIAPSLVVAIMCARYAAGTERWHPAGEAAALAVGLATWWITCWFALGFWAGVDAAVIIAAILVRTRQRWWFAAASALLLTGAVLVAPTLPADKQLEYLIGETVMILVALFALMSWRYRIELLVERREKALGEIELAKANERARLAGDLHDIQGHTLHTVNFKVAAAQVLIDANPNQARQELNEVQDLVDEAIRQSADLVYDRHETRLSVEVANAAQLLESAGIDCAVEFEATPPDRFESLAAHLVREATTNILRHADAHSVSLKITPELIRIENDGVRDQGSTTSGTGLARLGKKFELSGARLVAEQRGGFFEVEARFAPQDELVKSP
jgi:two-component system sensor histidine kinase DesK